MDEVDRLITQMRDQKESVVQIATALKDHGLPLTDAATALIRNGYLAAHHGAKMYLGEYSLQGYPVPYPWIDILQLPSVSWD